MRFCFASSAEKGDSLFADAGCDVVFLGDQTRGIRFVHEALAAVLAGVCIDECDSKVASRDESIEIAYADIIQTCSGNVSEMILAHEDYEL